MTVYAPMRMGGHPLEEEDGGISIKTRGTSSTRACWLRKLSERTKQPMPLALLKRPRRHDFCRVGRSDAYMWDATLYFAARSVLERATLPIERFEQRMFLEALPIGFDR